MADLILTRLFKAPRAAVWAAWTRPEHLRKWFAPAPVVITEAEIDLRPGGRFMTTMRMGGETLPVNDGCILEVVPEERLTYTNTLLAGYVPAPDFFMFFTAIVTMADHADGTDYRIVARHRDQMTADRHEEMGFSQGWGQCADQLGDVALGLA